MKKVILLILLFIGTKNFAQTNGITYQAVILNSKGEQLPGVNNPNAFLVSKDICMLFKFVDEYSNVEYQEVVQTKTDEFGMVNLIIGSGSQTGGYASSFQEITWNSISKKMIVAINTNGSCSSFTEISNQPFNSVPFSYFAKNAENVTGVVPIENGGTNALTVVGAKSNLGIENVNNTTDLDKPISTAAQVEFNLKENLSNKSISISSDHASDVKYPTVKSVKTYVDAATTSATSLLVAEIARATTAETVLTNTLTAEAVTARAAEVANAIAIGAEATRAGIAEVANTDAITTEKNRAIEAEGILTTAIETNATAITNEKNRAIAVEGTLTTDLALEATRATDAETTIAGSIIEEANTRAAADEILTTGLVLKAPLASPTFTGAPLAPTASIGTNTTQIATTEFVDIAITNKFVDLTTDQTIKGAKTFVDGIKTIKIDTSASLDQESTNLNASAGGSFQWQSFTANMTGILSAVEWKMSNPTFPYGSAASVTVKIYQGEGVSGSLLGTAISITPSDGTSAYVNFNLDSQNISTVLGSVYTIVLATPAVQIGWLGLSTSNSYSLGRANNDPNWDYIFKTYVKRVNEESYWTNGDSAIALALKAPLESPTFTGTPFAPNPTAGTATTQIATTEFVTAAISSAIIEGSDEFAATNAQITFTLAKTPSLNCKVKMYVNGIRISNTSYSWIGAILTYDSANNGGYTLSLNDRIQFDYFYNN